MGRIVHRYHSVYDEWTRCSRFVNGSTRLDVTDKSDDVTCLACSTSMRRKYEEAGAEKQSK